MISEMGKRVRLAREHAHLTQAALVKRLEATQAMVSRAESGTARISGAYIGRVLKACKLPAVWVPEREVATARWAPAGLAGPMLTTRCAAAERPP